MRIRGPATLLLLFTFSTAACERTPVEPLDETDLAALSLADGPRQSSLTLSGLLYSAIGRVHSEQGIAAARELVRSVALIQHRLDGAAVDERPALRRALREEQLRIVLLVHDRDVVRRTIRGVSEEAAILGARSEALAQSGIAVPEAAAILKDLPDLLDLARTASSDLEALDAATRAAARTDRMRAAIAGAARLPSLQDLFDDAARRLALRSAPDALAEVNALRAAAHDAARSDDRAHAQAAAEAARSAQIGVVLAVLGPDAVADVIDWSRRRVDEQEQKLAAAAALRDVSRLERMYESASDMLRRADMRLRSGDNAGALDLAAHAVDLLNALETTLTGS
ncbi:MAG TPA: hypothetical protein VK912_00760 [Longimicrobiales bacterium]|nr:hypothetical protein [Longimicrobiales bacterium]